MSTTPSLALFAAMFVVACSSTVVESNPGGGGGGATSTSTGTFCAPGSTKSCTCHAISLPGLATCLPDGSGYAECLEQDGGTCECPAGRSDGCCYGDGLCCACVKGCGQEHEFSFPDPVVDALIACVCAAGVCADECKSECDHGGIGMTCAPCVRQAGMDQCKDEYQACGGT